MKKSPVVCSSTYMEAMKKSLSPVVCGSMYMEAMKKTQNHPERTDVRRNLAHRLQKSEDSSLPHLKAEGYRQ